MTIRLTMAQALVRYLGAQRTEFEGGVQPLFAGVWAIFGHGNVAALGEALWHARDTLPLGIIDMLIDLLGDARRGMPQKFGDLDDRGALGDEE